jgi:hypothetical protein
MSDLAQADHRIHEACDEGFSRFDRMLRDRVLGQLRALGEGHIILSDACGVVELGTATQDAPVRIGVTDAAFYRAVEPAKPTWPATGRVTTW